jgi:hypothetical protein
MSIGDMSDLVGLIVQRVSRRPSLPDFFRCRLVNKRWRAAADKYGDAAWVRVLLAHGKTRIILRRHIVPAFSKHNPNMWFCNDGVKCTNRSHWTKERVPVVNKTHSLCYQAIDAASLKYCEYWYNRALAEHALLKLCEQQVVDCAEDALRATDKATVARAFRDRFLSSKK